MAYDEDKDKTLFHQENGEGLHFSVHQYNGGDPKVQIGPRVVTTKSGEERYMKTGRLSLKEFKWVCGLMPKMKKAIGAK